MSVHKCRVLLVDDHPQVRQTLRTLLLPHEDVEVIGSCQPDIILMDINMPRMNGIEAAGIIKRSWTDTIIIGLCVVQDTYIVDAFLKSGATAVISKDRFDDLYGTIQRACTRKISWRHL
jgi:DNA-binding NarL/FixJ family response regulator